MCSFKATNQVNSIPQLTGHYPRWQTLMALPGHRNLARHDLYGFRPRPQQHYSRAFNQFSTTTNGDREFLNTQLSRRTTMISRSRLPPVNRPVTPTIIGNITNNDNKIKTTATTINAGHVTSVTQTLQNRMASAAVEAAAARSARVTKRI